MGKLAVKSSGEQQGSPADDGWQETPKDFRDHPTEEVDQQRVHARACLLRDQLLLRGD
jgi:hypothetical protein